MKNPKGESFLKKSGGILCKRNRLEAYRFIEKYHDDFGLRWLLKWLDSIVRPQKPICKHAKPHKVFDNRIHQDFIAEKPNQKWCTDFTYLFLKNHEMRYNCTILDIYDRSVIASITDWNFTSDLVVRMLKKALEFKKPM